LLLIKDCTNLEDYLRSYFAPLDQGELKWQSFFSIIPLNWIFHLKGSQFQKDRLVKDCRHSTFPKQLNIGSFTFEPRIIKVYRLILMADHIGEIADGHYIAFYDRRW
jgi:hypothetical protein